jgi:hypothetical protein
MEFSERTSIFQRKLTYDNASRKRKCFTNLGFWEVYMASAKFLRRQAEKCADLARLTSDEDARQRYEQLQRTYRFLAEAEELKKGKGVREYPI